MNLGDGMKKVQAALDEMKIPPSIRVQYGGQFEEQQKSFKDLLVVLALAVVLVFIVLIMVIGIVAKNGILLLDADQKFRAAGLAAEESMIRAGERRLRPIMMTVLATVAGMLPLAFAFGAGSQMLQPLAIAVIGGILASMVLSLVVTPAVRYYLGGRT